jgi:hypothetical protein
VVDIPDYIVLERHRDLDGVRKHSWPRHLILALIAVFAVLALLDVFGQRPSTSTASATSARLELYAPSHLRGGLLFSARFRIDAVREVRDATLVLDPGWLEGMAVNTIEPSPVNEASRDGKLTLRLGHIPAGHSSVLWMQFQVNPTNVAWRRPAGVTLLDGSRTLLRLDRSVTIFP